MRHFCNTVNISIWTVLTFNVTEFSNIKSQDYEFFSQNPINSTVNRVLSQWEIINPVVSEFLYFAISVMQIWIFFILGENRYFSLLYSFLQLSFPSSGDFNDLHGVTAEWYPPRSSSCNICFSFSHIIFNFQFPKPVEFDGFRFFYPAISSMLFVLYFSFEMIFFISSIGCPLLSST